MPPPTIRGVLETVLYVADLKRSDRFYSDVLGFERIGREPGRSLFYRAGSSVFLVFEAGATSRPGSSLPPHGAFGSVHTCFLVAREDYEPWKSWLRASGVAIEQEARWRNGASFYFRDPDGNLLEIANHDIWPSGSGRSLERSAAERDPGP